MSSKSPERCAVTLYGSGCRLAAVLAGWGADSPQMWGWFPPKFVYRRVLPSFWPVLCHAPPPFCLPLYRACISCISQVLKTCVDLGPRYTYSIHDSNRLYRYFTIHANTCTPNWTRSRHGGIGTALVLALPSSFTPLSLFRSSALSFKSLFSARLTEMLWSSFWFPLLLPFGGTLRI